METGGKALRLWCQSLARQTESTPYGAILRKVIDSCADPGTSVHVRGVSETAGIGVHYRFLEYHDAGEVIHNAIRAEKEGFDAYLIGKISDAGIYEIGRVPVLNGIVELIKMGETAVKLRRITGRCTSKRLGCATPTGDFLERMRSFHGPEIYPGAK